MDKKYYKRQYQLACEEIARLSAVLYTLREDMKNILKAHRKPLGNSLTLLKTVSFGMDF